MKKYCKIIAIAVIVVLSGCTSKTLDTTAVSEVERTKIQKVETNSEDYKEDEKLKADDSISEEQNQKSPFYGIWCGASKTEPEAEKMAERLQEKGFSSQVFITTDWSNLNREPWYVVTAGVYLTKEEAEAELPKVQEVDTKAYVKYTGDYIGSEVGEVDVTNTFTLNNYIGVYNLWNADGPGYQMIITSISDNQISGAYAQIFDSEDTQGRYSEFTTALSNNQFTINGTEVKMQLGEAYEIEGWSGVTGTFSLTYTLTYIDGVPVIIDKNYDTYSTYLKRIDSLSSGTADYFWKFYSKVNGEYWKDISVIDYSSYVGLYKGIFPLTEDEARNLDIDYVEIESISNGWIKGHYYVCGRLSFDTDFYVKLSEDGSFDFSYEGVV